MKTSEYLIEAIESAWNSHQYGELDGWEFGPIKSYAKCLIAENSELLEALKAILKESIETDYRGTPGKTLAKNAIVKAEGGKE